MKKLFTIFMLLLVLTLTLTACSFNGGNQGTNLPDEEKNEEETPIPDFDPNQVSFETAYAKAQSLGFTGTLQEFIELISGKNGENGKDGLGIANTLVNKDGNLIIYYTDGTWVNCGKVVGEDGKDGTPGKDGQTPTLSINADGYWVINGVVTEHKAIGQNGEKGESGLSIQSIAFDDHGRLIITMSDGTMLDPISIGNKQEYTHSYDEWIAFRGGDCSNRIYYAICSECNELTWKHGTFNDHSFTTQTIPPTCVDDGYDLATCIHCNHQITSSPTDAIGHDWLAEIETVPPTCGDQGYDIRTCAVCSETEKINYKDATGNHSWSLRSDAEYWTGSEPCHHYETCAVCLQTQNKAACTADTTNHCTVCENIIPTYGYQYEISDDNTYAIFTGRIDFLPELEQKPQTTVISDNYCGLPVTSVREDALFYQETTTLILPFTITHFPSSLFDYYYCIVDEKNSLFCSVNGILYSKDMTTLLHLPASITEFTIPASVTTLADNALHTNLESLSFAGNGISELKLNGYKKLETLVVPEGVQRLTLTDFVPKILHLPSTLQEVRCWGYYEFYILSELHINMEIGKFVECMKDCGWVQDHWLFGVSLYIKGEKIDELIIPADCAVINDMFSGLDVDRVIVEEGVTHVDLGAFSCIYNIDIYLPKSMVSYDIGHHLAGCTVYTYFLLVNEYENYELDFTQYLISETPPAEPDNS